MMNDTQREILDRVSKGEHWQYHPGSIQGGEVIEMRNAGQIEIITDQQGFCWIAPPKWTQCRECGKPVGDGDDICPECWCPCSWCGGDGEIEREGITIQCTHCEGTGEAGEG